MELQMQEISADGLMSCVVWRMMLLYPRDGFVSFVRSLSEICQYSPP